MSIVHEIKQPWVVLLAAVFVIAAVCFQSEALPSGEKAPFLFSVTILTGLATKAVAAASMGARATAAILIVLALFLTGMTMLLTDISVFLDAVWEGILSGLAGLCIALIGELQLRHAENGD